MSSKVYFILWKYCVLACSGWTRLSTPGIRNVQCNYTNEYFMCSRTFFVNIYLSRSEFPCNQRHSHTCTSWQRQCTSHYFHKDCCRIHRYLKHRQYILNSCGDVGLQDGPPTSSSTTILLLSFSKSSFLSCGAPTASGINSYLRFSLLLYCFILSFWRSTYISHFSS